MRNETQELKREDTVRSKFTRHSENQESGDQHHSKVKVLKLNPSQLYHTFSREERICGELSCNSCSLQGQRTK